MLKFITGEAVKLFSLRSTWIYLILSAAAMFAAALLIMWSWGTGEPVTVARLFTGGDLSMIIVVFAAAMMAAADLTRGTVAWSYLSNNRRTGMLAAQVPLIVAAVTVAVSLGVGLAVPVIYALGGSVDFTVDAGTTETVVSYYVQWIVFATLAALLAVILRSGAFAAMIVIAEIFVVEAMLGAIGIDALRPVLDLLPLANIRVLSAGEFAGITHGRPAAAVILAVTVAVFAMGAALVVRRRAVR